MTWKITMRNKLKKNIFIKYALKAIMFAMIALYAFSPAAHADEASTDLTEQAQYFVSNSSWAGSTVDDNYQSYWYTNNAAYKYFRIESQSPIKYLYVCYAFKPSELTIQVSEDNRTWEDVFYETDNEYYHVTYTFDTPVYYIRIYGTPESIGKFGIVEFKVFSEGTLPDYVQSWQPTYETVDMMIFSAHPDDEAVFFSGLIPYYSEKMDKKVTVVYMTASDPCRRSEALNYQWAVHQNHLPIFAYFEDVYEEYTSNYTKSRWGEQKTIDYMVSVIREKKPTVIVSHDLNGEYGHGNHIFTSQCLLQAVVLANDPEYHPESYEAYGTHEVKKVYLHLYEDNTIHLDVLDEPIEAFDNLTAIEVAQIALEQYASQIKYQVVRVHDDTSEFSCYNYGLAYTTVGYDTQGNDMFENTEPEPSPTPVATPTPAASPTVSPAATIYASAEPGKENFLNLSKTTSLIICIAAGIICLMCILLIVSLVKKKS